MKIRVQEIQDDGTYYDIYSHPIYYIIRNVLDAPKSGAGFLS
jgi:hypothetical protein